MSEDAAERRKRLKALKEKAASKSKGIKFRNYRPQDPAIKQQALDGKRGGEASSGAAVAPGNAGKGRTADQEEEEEEEEEGKRKKPAPSLIQLELKRQKETQDEEELNIAPKKANWDLKRDVEKKLEKLNRRTQRAIVEIIRERMAEEAANASSSEEEGSGSSSSGEEGSGMATSGPALSPVRRDAWTADAGCLGSRRLRFRSQPIHELVSSTLLSIDPSGIFSMYEEWSNIKNRILPQGLDEQRSDLALYEELRQEDDDSSISEDGADASYTTVDVFPERPSHPGEIVSNCGGGDGGACRDTEEADDQEREHDRTPGDIVQENQEHSEDRPAGVAPVSHEVPETPELDISDTEAGGGGTAAKPFGESSPPPPGVDGLPGASADAALQDGRAKIEARLQADVERNTNGGAGDVGCGAPAREPGLPPLRLFRESSEGALRLGNMALGDPHVMALLASLNHLPSLTSIDVSANRMGSAAIQKVVLTAKEKGVASLDLSSNHVDRACTDVLCAFLAGSRSLSSLVVKNAGVGNLAGAAIMAAIGNNTNLKTLDLSGNDIGGTSDLLATHKHELGSIASSSGGGGMLGEEAGGGRAVATGRLTGSVAIATCLESNYWLTHLDLSWNKIGEMNAATIGASIEYNQGLRWLSLAGNRAGDLGAFSLAMALAENSVLTHLDVSFNGISCNGAAALALGLRANSAIKSIQLNGNLLGWAGGRALFRTLNFSEIPRVIGIRDCDEFAEGDLDAFDPRFPGGPFDLDLSNPSQRALAQDIIFAASYRTGCSLARVSHLDSPEGTATIGRGALSLNGLCRARQLCSLVGPRPRRKAQTISRSITPHLAPGRGLTSGPRWKDCSYALLARASHGDSRRPADCQGLWTFNPYRRAWRTCATPLIQQLIGHLAGSANPLNSAELLEMMTAVAPQVYDNDGLPDLIETNLSPMGRRMLVAQLGEAYPAFTGGVSGPFDLDLRFPAHRLAAVRLAEAENVQERERKQSLERDRERQQQESERRDKEEGEEVTASEKGEDGSTRIDEPFRPSNLLGHWCGFRNVKYKPTRAATSNAASENAAAGVDGAGEEGASDAPGGEEDASDIPGDGGEDGSAPAAGVGAAKTGLGESMVTFFQRGLLDRPTGVLQLDFVSTLRPPKGTQPISDLALARMLNSCGMLDPNFWCEYLRPSSFPVSFVDLIRLLRVKGRGDKRQAKLLVLLLRVKNSMFRAAHAEKKRKGILGTSMRRYRMGGALAAFQKSAARSPTSIASAVVAKHATASKGTPSDNASTARIAASQVFGADQNKASSDKKTAAPADSSVVGAKFSSTAGNHASQIATASNATAGNAGDIPHAASAAAPPGAAEEDTATTANTITAAAPSAPNRKPNALGPRGRFSTMSRVVKSFPRSGDGRGERLQAGARNRAAAASAEAAGAADCSGGQQQATGAGEPKEPTPTQAAVLAADKKLERLLNVGGILQAKSGGESPQGFPHGTPAWDSAEEVVGSEDRANCGGSGGDRSDLCGGVHVSSGGSARDIGIGAVVADDNVGRVMMEWASRFCEPETGFPAANSEEGVRLGRALARHVARDGNAGLVGTRPPTLLVHGLCIRVRHREADRVLRVKRISSATSKKDLWAAVSRQGMRGSSLRVGAKREVTSALRATFASCVQQRDWTSVMPRTLGTLNMTQDEDWREAFVPTELLACNALGDSLPLRLLVTFVEVSSHFLPDGCVDVSEFVALDHQQIETAYEWVPSDQGPEVVNTSFEPDLSRSLAQLRSRLGSCWLSSAQAATVASLVPRVVGGRHYGVDAVVFLFSRVLDLENFRQVVDILHEKKRAQLLRRLGDIEAFCPANTAPAPEITSVASTPHLPGAGGDTSHRAEGSSRKDMGQIDLDS
eukprot:g13467.t1